MNVSPRFHTRCCLCHAPALIGLSRAMQLGINRGRLRCRGCGAELFVQILEGEACTEGWGEQHEQDEATRAVARRIAEELFPAMFRETQPEVPLTTDD